MGKGRGKGRGMSCSEFCEDFAEISRSDPGKAFWCFMILAVCTFIIVFFSLTIETVPSTMVALPYDTVKCVLKDEIKEEGMHFKTAFGALIKARANTTGEIALHG